MSDRVRFQFVLILLGWIVIGLLARWLYQRYCSRKYVKVIATVTNMDSYLSTRGSRGGRIEVYNPELTYEWNGWQRVVRPRAYASYFKYQPGDEVLIYINPDKPDEILYDDLNKKMFRGLWFIGLLIIVLHFTRT